MEPGVDMEHAVHGAEFFYVVIALYGITLVQ